MLTATPSCDAIRLLREAYHPVSAGSAGVARRRLGLGLGSRFGAVQRASAYMLLQDIGPNPLRACPECGWIGSTRALRIVDSAKQ